MQRFHVMRRHDGDKEYHEGDVREASLSDVKHLVDMGVLKAAKADTPLKNKMEDGAENKRQASSEAASAAAKAKAAEAKAAEAKVAEAKAAGSAAAEAKAAEAKARG